MECTVPRNFGWLIPGRIAALGFPDQLSDFNYLIQNGIVHLVSLTRELKPQVDQVPQLKWTDIGVEDFATFSMEQVNQFIQICKDAHQDQQAVAVHCRAGIGRTGTMLACYLVHFHQMGFKEAIERVRAVRPGSIETAAQEQTVAEYYNYLREDF